MPYARIWPGLAVSGKTLIAAGGSVIFDKENPLVFKSSPAVGTSNVQALDLDNLERGWYELPPIPGTERGLFGIAAVGSRVYVFSGGYGKGYVNYGDLRGYHKDAYVLDLGKLRWRRLPDFPFRAHGIDAAPYLDRYIVLTGGMKIMHQDRSDLLPEQSPNTDSGNFEVVVFDTQLEAYRTLPSRVPPLSDERSRPGTHLRVESECPAL